MKKNFISIILSIALLFGFFVFNVGAEEENDKLTDAAGILCYLGVIDENDTSDTDKMITRGQFAVYLSRLIKAEAYDEENVFNDISDEKELKAALALSSAGILNGYGDKIFKPNKNITINEMVIASVRTLGYKNIVEDSEYFYIATREELTKNIAVTGDASLADGIVILYNLLHASTVTYTEENSVIREAKGKTIIETFFRLWYINGQVTANEYTGFDGDETNSPFIIRIDGKLYDTSNKEIGDFIGYNVTAYYSIDDDKIMYFVPDRKTEVLKISSDDFDSYIGKNIYYNTDNNKKKSIKLENDVVIIKNSKIVDTDYAAAFDMDFGTIECISHNGEYDVVIISSYRNFKINSVDISNRILYTDKVDENKDPIKIELENCDYAKFVTVPYGKEVNENTILPDDLISVSMSEDKKIIRGYVCAEHVTGKIESISSDNRITINGIEYKTDPEFYSEQVVAVGDTGTFILDIAGRIALSLDYNPKGNKIGYIYKLYTDEVTDRINIRLFNTQGEHVNAELTDKVVYDGKQKTQNEVKNSLCTLSGNKLRCQLVMYNINDDGKINSIDSSAETKDLREKDGTLYNLLSSGSHFWYYQMKSFDRKYVLTGNTYYMRVPADNSGINDTSLFGCQRFSAVTWYNQTKSINILGLYKFNDDNPYADVLLVGNTDGASLTNQTEATVVSSVREECVNDEAVIAIHGYRRGVEVTAYIEKDNYRNDVEEGDIIRFVNKVDGYVGGYEIVYDVSEDQTLWKKSSTSNDYSSNLSSVGEGLRYTFGYVNKLYIAPYTSGVNSTIEIGAQPGQTDDIYQIDTSSSATTRFIVFDKDRRSNRVYMGHLDEIIPYESSQDIMNTSRVFIHARSGWVVAIIIYK